MLGEAAVEPHGGGAGDVDGEDGGVHAGGGNEATAPEGVCVNRCARLGEGGDGDGVGVWVEVELESISNGSLDGVGGEGEGGLADGDLVGHNTRGGGEGGGGGT